MAENSRQVTGIISAVAFSFMVQEPSGIIARSSARSRSARRRMYRVISLSARFMWNIGWVRYALSRSSASGSR